jgi:hypothetical protein
MHVRDEKRHACGHIRHAETGNMRHVESVEYHKPQHGELLDVEMNTDV